MRSLKSFLPRPDHLRKVKSLSWLGHLLFDPDLWHFSRRSTANGALIGSICCFLPIPFQMVPCALLCVSARANVPLAFVLVWVSNPVTMPVMFYFAYRVGALVLGTPEVPFDIELSVDWMLTQFGRIWQPLLLGSLVCGFTMGIVLFVGIRLYWRWRIVRRWQQRSQMDSEARN